MNSPPRIARATVARTSHEFRPLSPPAIWTAFAQQGRWKNWVMLAQLIVIALLVMTCLAIAKTDPDVVVVDAGGDSHYVRREVSNAALLNFLAEQKGQPSDVTVLAFTRRFVQLFFAPNSSTVRETSREALGLMDAKLKASSEGELQRGETVEKLEALKVRSELVFDAVDQVERTPSLIHLKVRLVRTMSSLLDGADPKRDSLAVDLVLRVVPRTPARPDGLELAEMIVSPASPGEGTKDQGTRTTTPSPVDEP
jgi:hypothetical protein